MSDEVPKLVGQMLTDLKTLKSVVMLALLVYPDADYPDADPD